VRIDPPQTTEEYGASLAVWAECGSRYGLIPHGIVYAADARLIADSPKLAEVYAAAQRLVASAEADGPLDWIHKGSKDAWRDMKNAIAEIEKEGKA
jgi:hypothetical protein